jgi:hypothetical protein
MGNRKFIDTIVVAAIVVVILPLLVGIAAVAASFGIEVAAGPGFGMFGPMGTPHVLMLAWTIVAVLIISTLVGLLMNDRQHHA